MSRKKRHLSPFEGMSFPVPYVNPAYKFEEILNEIQSRLNRIREGRDKPLAAIEMKSLCEPDAIADLFACVNKLWLEILVLDGGITGEMVKDMFDDYKKERLLEIENG